MNPISLSFGPLVSVLYNLMESVQTVYMQALWAAARTKHKMKGQIADLPGAAVAIGVLVMIIAIVAIILIAFNDSVDDSTAEDIIDEGIAGMTTFSTYVGVIVIVVISGVLISLVFGYFYGRAKGRKGA